MSLPGDQGLVAVGWGSMLSEPDLCEYVFEALLVGMVSQCPPVPSFGNGCAFLFMQQVVANLLDHLIDGVERVNFPAEFIVVFKMCRTLRQEKPASARDLEISALDLFGAASG